MTDLPGVFVEIDGTWPPARDGLPVGTSIVGAWSMERELVGSTLPGNVRGRSGLSVGSASAEIPQTTDGPLAPWATGDSKVTAGSPVELYAAETHDSARVTLGDWQVAPVSGALTSPGVALSLIEASFEGRRKPAIVPATGQVLFPGCDPIAMVDALARQCGYYATPESPSMVASAPLQGGTLGFVGGSPAPYYDTATGILSPHWTGGGGIYLADAAAPLGDATNIFITLCLSGTVQILIPSMDSMDSSTVEITSTGALRVRNSDSAAWSEQAFTPGLSTRWPSRVQIEIALPRDADGEVAASISARARSAPDAAWSAWAIESTPATGAAGRGVSVLTSSEADTFAALAVSTAADAELWDAPTAELDLLGGTIDAPWLDSQMDAWTAIQLICSTWLGAAFVGLDGVLRVRNRAFIAGDTSVSTHLDVAHAAEDVAWTVDPADQADRLIVTFNPPTWSSGDYPVVWEATEPIEVPAKSTVTVLVDLPVYAEMLWPFEPEWVPTVGASQWNARPSIDGTGGQPSDSALVVTIDPAASSGNRVVIKLENRTPSNLFTVDSTGAPVLRIKAFAVATQDTQSAVARGVPTDSAQSLLEIDLGRLVQRPEDASSIADFIWGRVSQPMWKASSVRVLLDWSRDIGDVVRLVHEPSGLDVEAMITKVSLSGQSGEVVQTLDLVLLPPTWTKFDKAWAAGTWADFDALWAGQTWIDFDNDPLRSA